MVEAILAYSPGPDGQVYLLALIALASMALASTVPL